MLLRQLQQLDVALTYTHLANMVYWNDDREFKQELTATQTVIYTNVPVNTDYNIMDCYVYLPENNGSNQYYERLLIKDVDYVIKGSTITLATAATAVSANDPSICYITNY